MNSRFKPPSIVASWLVNTQGFNVFIIVVLLFNAAIICADVELRLQYPGSLEWLHTTVDIISLVGK